MAEPARSPQDLPALCVDTCSILDLMRDPTRDTARPRDRLIAIDLVTAAEAGIVQLFMAEQVAIEFAEHDQPVQDEAKRNIKKLREQVERVDRLVAVLGGGGKLDLSHFDDHVDRARLLVGRWLARLEIVVPSAGAPGKAFARINAGIAPARRGKESSKDCLVYETLLEKAADLRASGITGPIVFLSSNTADYLTEGRSLKAEIAKEFEAFGIDYAPNVGAAWHALRLGASR